MFSGENDSAECIISNDAYALLKYPAYQDMITKVLAGRNETNTAEGVSLAGGKWNDNLMSFSSVQNPRF